MTTLNLWNSTWSLDEAQCPCDVHFLDYLEREGVRNAAIFHFGTGNHHVVGLKTATNGSNNAVLGVTASRHEYEAYIDLLVENPHIGHTYKAYFGDIYQLDPRLLPDLDFASLFHVGEYRTKENDAYGALTDNEMVAVVAGKLKKGGKMLFFSGSFAYDKAEAAGNALIAKGVLAACGEFKTLKILERL
ncbi:MAG: hypothetical protein NW223_22610 [Hyphomicrobiaceae bacterium]|nr:hypothetical protein [Hyphomicrobiaceae bacterium]